MGVMFCGVYVQMVGLWKGRITCYWAARNVGVGGIVCRGCEVEARSIGGGGHERRDGGV